MPKRRLIFLDVDGVICCNSSGQLEPAKLAELQRIVRLTGAKLVLSTALDSWFQMVSKESPWVGSVLEPGARRLPGRRVSERPQDHIDPERPQVRVSHSGSHSQSIGLAAPARAEGEDPRCAPKNRRRMCRRNAAACNVPAGTPLC